MENEKNNNQLQIELKEEVAQGTYENLAIITHTSSEFIVDFVRVMPGLPKAGVPVSYTHLTPSRKVADGKVDISDEGIEYLTAEAVSYTHLGTCQKWCR